MYSYFPDAATNKQIPKQSRRREPAGSVPKNETSGRNKPMPQKFKSFDKRPKPRGSFAGGKEGPKVTNVNFEFHTPKWFHTQFLTMD
jgi:hypothetical protein